MSTRKKEKQNYRKLDGREGFNLHSTKSLKKPKIFKSEDMDLAKNDMEE